MVADLVAEVAVEIAGISVGAAVGIAEVVVYTAAVAEATVDRTAEARHADLDTAVGEPRSLAAAVEALASRNQVPAADLEV